MNRLLLSGVEQPNGLVTSEVPLGMSVFHDEVEIEDFEYNEEKEVYFYPCPCGDVFEISKVVFRF